MCHNIEKYNSWTLGYKTFFYYKLMFKSFQLCTISSLVQNQTTRRNFSVHKTLFYWNVTSSLCNVFLLLIHSIKGHTFGYILDVVFLRRKVNKIKSYEKLLRICLFCLKAYWFVIWKCVCIISWFSGENKTNKTFIYFFRKVVTIHVTCSAKNVNCDKKGIWQNGSLVLYQFVI